MTSKKTLIEQHSDVSKEPEYQETLHRIIRLRFPILSCSMHSEKYIVDHKSAATAGSGSFKQTSGGIKSIYPFAVVMQALVRALSYAVTEPICNRFVKLQ